MSKQSEFGKGLVVCLVKFYEHFGTEQLSKIYFNRNCLRKSKEDQEKIRSGNPPGNLDYGRDRNEGFDFWMSKMVPIHGSVESTLSSDVTLWANGASDHLYEIKTPKGNDWKEIRKIVKQLKEKGLNMGHGDGLMGSKIYSLEDVDELRNLTEEALVIIDKKLGLKANWGKW